MIKHIGNHLYHVILGYWLKKGYQTVTFLTKNDSGWMINGDVNIGIYFKKSGKISEYKVPNKITVLYT